VRAVNAPGSASREAEFRDNPGMAQTSAPQAEAPVQNAAAAVSARGVTREFGDLVALDEVAFALPTGQTLAVLGPNGAGKSTLLRILATLLRPSAGSVEALGHPLPAEAWRVRGRIGYLGHRPLLYRDLTVAENLDFHARLHRVERPGERIGHLLARVGMDRRAGELVRNLSAGMAQRVAVCRVVLHEPDLLLLDEPGAHLDPEATELVEPLIGRASGMSRVVVSHDVEGALRDSDRVLLLRAGGRVTYEGPADGLSPGDARAAYGGRP
jgi:heme exporter protein A